MTNGGYTLSSLVSILHYSLPPNDEWTQFDGWSRSILEQTGLWMEFITTSPEMILAIHNHPTHYEISEDAIVDEERFHNLMMPLLRQGAKEAFELRMHGYQRMYRFKGKKMIDAIIILRTMLPGKITLSEAFELVCFMNGVRVGDWEEKPDGGKSRHAFTEDRPDKDAPWIAFVGNDDDLFELRRARSMGVRPINFTVEFYE
jgi:hypothetical protein